MTDKRSADALILDLYDAALDSRLWEGMAEKFAALLDAPSVAIQIQNTVNGSVEIYSQTANFDAKSLDAYRSYYAEKDILIGRVRAHRTGTPVTNQEVITDRDWAETEIYRDFFAARGVFHVLGTVFATSDEGIGVLGVHRPHNHAPFDEESKCVAAPVLTHLERALRIHQRINKYDLARDGAVEALERSRAALMIVDRSGRLLYAAPEGDRLLQRSLDLTVVAGRVIATQLSVHQRLMRAVHAAANTANGTPHLAEAIVAIPRRDGSPLSVLVAPFRPNTARLPFSAPAVLLIVRDPDRPIQAAQAVKELFGLTPTEAAITAALVNGQSLQAIAAANGVTFNTVRSQLKAISLKTGAKRQSDLVALVLKSVAGLV